MQALLSLALGLSGVALARTVFVNKERRTTGLTARTSETLPLTMVAMLITGVIIWDRNLGMSLSVFTGLGVGWTAILLLDVIGVGVLNMLRRAMGQPPVMPPVTPIPGDVPDDQVKLINKLDRKDLVP